MQFAGQLQAEMLLLIMCDVFERFLFLKPKNFENFKSYVLYIFKAVQTQVKGHN